MEKQRYNKAFLSALAGATLTLAGDFLLGANPPLAQSTGSALVDVFAEAVNSSDLRLVLAGFLGAVGIPLEGVGYWGIYKLFQKDKGFMRGFYKFAVLMYVGLAGAGTHLSTCASSLLYKWISVSD